MISSRRLAREWALKILYQRDVSKSSLADAQDSAMGRLRREFVLRGSRTASGSTSEQLCLEAITAALQDWLATISSPAMSAVALVAGQLLGEAPYWQELRLEKAMRTTAPGLSLVPPRLLAPQPYRDRADETGETAQRAVAALSHEEQQALRAFAVQMRETLPGLLEPELRLRARTFARDLAANRPMGADSTAVQEYLRTRREAFNRVEQERWRRVGNVVLKQTDDWMRTASFVTRLVHGVSARQSEIDRAIEGLSAGWRLERQVAVDRNILRLAGYEMLYLPGVPTGASINEAVELAKKYSTTESGRFVNGVLGALAALAGDKTVAAGEHEDADDVLDLPDISAIEESE